MYNNKSLKKKEKKKVDKILFNFVIEEKVFLILSDFGGNWIRIDHGYSLDDADFSFLRGWSNRRG